MNKTNLFTILIIIISIAISIYLYPQMPEKIASHWNASGEVNGYMPKFWALFLMPIISIAIFLLLILIPKIDPRKENIKKFNKQYNRFILLLISFIFYIHLLTIFWNLNIKFNMIEWLIPAFAILFFYAGILIENAKPNWFIGIRTPWTLSNEFVWNKTHKLGGKLFKASTLIALMGLLLPNYAICFIIIPIILSAIYLFVYSYIEYKKEKI